MREIKFRVWDNVDYMSKPFTLYELQAGLVQVDSVCPLMQFTGLKDKNGVEIYEGDIIGSQNTVGNYRCSSHHVISWHDTGFKGKQIGTYGAYIGIDYYTQGHNPYIVVGNIHENPELLASKGGEL